MLQSIVPSDFALLSQNKIVNLRKIFPYIPEKLNNILLHFSVGAEVFYETADELRADLSDALQAW